MLANRDDYSSETLIPLAQAFVNFEILRVTYSDAVMQEITIAAKRVASSAGFKKVRKIKKYLRCLHDQYTTPQRRGQKPKTRRPETRDVKGHQHFSNRQQEQPRYPPNHNQAPQKGSRRRRRRRRQRGSQSANATSSASHGAHVDRSQPQCDFTPPHRFAHPVHQQQQSSRWHGAGWHSTYQQGYYSNGYIAYERPSAHYMPPCHGQPLSHTRRHCHCGCHCECHYVCL